MISKSSTSAFNPKTSPKIDFSTPFQYPSLSQKSALITGGASGLGAEFAVELARLGCHVTIVDKNVKLGRAFAVEQQTKGLKINFAQADVTDYHSLLRAFKSALAYSPGETIDIVIPSAGIFGPRINHLLPDPTFSEDPPAPSTAVMDVNFKGVYLTTYLALHFFRRASHDHTSEATTPLKQILFISSLMAYIEAPMNLSYCGAKHGVRGLFRSLRWEGAGLQLPRLQVNLLAPQLTKTPLSKDLWRYLRDERGFAMSLPEEVIEAGMRVVCDEEVDGRAVTVLSGGEAVDLCDDFEGSEGGREVLKLLERGVLGRGPSATGRYIA